MSDFQNYIRKALLSINEEKRERDPKIKLILRSLLIEQLVIDQSDEEKERVGVKGGK